MSVRDGVHVCRGEGQGGRGHTVVGKHIDPGLSATAWTPILDTSLCGYFLLPISQSALKGGK